MSFVRGSFWAGRDQGHKVSVSFWLLGLILALLLFAASAPSPLYREYQTAMGFSPLTLTAIYASYAIGGIATLLTTGRLSDHLGRRPVLIAALAIEVIAMLLFIWATDVLLLFAARILTGMGIGIAAGAVSAWLLDLAPPADPQLGSVVNGAGPLLGLGGGALFAAALAEYGPARFFLVYQVLAVIYLIAIVTLVTVPGGDLRRPGWRTSMRPTIGVPATVRPTFIAATPSIVGMWALGGLYLALGPSLALETLETTNRLFGGLIIFALCGTGAAASFFLRRADANRLLVVGAAVVIIGVGVTLLGVLSGNPALLYGGSVVAGVGLGGGFSAFVRVTSPMVLPEQRGALVAAIYVVVFVSFSVPTIAAGALVSAFGLRSTALGYGVVVMALAAATTVAVSRRLKQVVSAPAS